MAREGWWMGFESIDQSGQHQKLNVIQKWAFHFFGWREVPDEVRVHQPAWLIIRSEHNPKRSISFYWLERGGRWALSPLTSQADHQKLNVIKKSAFHFFWQERSGRWGSSSSISPVDHQKWTQSKNKHFIFWLESSGGWGSSPLTSTAYHQKLNIIKIWAFHFLGWRWGVDWV